MFRASFAFPHPLWMQQGILTFFADQNLDDLAFLILLRRMS